MREPIRPREKGALDYFVEKSIKLIEVKELGYWAFRFNETMEWIELEYTVKGMRRDLNRVCYNFPGLVEKIWGKEGGELFKQVFCLERKFDLTGHEKLLLKQLELKARKLKPKTWSASTLRKRVSIPKKFLAYPG